MRQFVRIITMHARAFDANDESLTTDQSGNLIRLDALINRELDNLQDDFDLVAIHPPVVTLLDGQGPSPTLHYAVMMVWEADDGGYDME